MIEPPKREKVRGIQKALLSTYLSGKSRGFNGRWVVEVTGGRRNS
jgi:hypothetical protein